MNINGSLSLSTDRLWGFTGSTCDQVPGRSRSLRKWWAPGLMVVLGLQCWGEKGPQLAPLSSCPVSCWTFDCDFWLWGGAEGLPSAWGLGCPRGPFVHGPKCLLCCEAIFLWFSLFVCPCAYIFPRELCVGCRHQHVNIYSCLFESLPTSLIASSPGSFFVSPGPDTRLAECLLKQPGFEIQSQITWTTSK